MKNTPSIETLDLKLSRSEWITILNVLAQYTHFYEFKVIAPIVDKITPYLKEIPDGK